MRTLVTVFALVTAGCQPSSLQTEITSAPAKAVTCVHVDGMIDGPHVDDEATARLIAIAIITRKESPETQRKYELNVHDGGSHWVAFQTVRGERDILGGGGLEMKISKCDGAISKIHWAR